MVDRKPGPAQDGESFIDILREIESYKRGVNHAQAMFENTKEFDRGVVGSSRVRILDGNFHLETIMRGDGGEPTSVISSLAAKSTMIEVLRAVPAEATQLNYQGHLLGFSDEYNRLLEEKHAETLDSLGITGTASITEVIEVTELDAAAQ